MAFTQAQIAIENEQTLTLVKQRVDAAFAAPEEFLRGIERKGLRVRNFEGVLESGALGGESKAQYVALNPAEQGMVREHYLAAVEKVDPAVRGKFKKLYSYYY